MHVFQVSLHAIKNRCPSNPLFTCHAICHVCLVLLGLGFATFIFCYILNFIYISFGWPVSSVLFIAIFDVFMRSGKEGWDSLSLVSIGKTSSIFSCLSVCLSVRIPPSVRLSVCFSIGLSVCLSDWILRLASKSKMYKSMMFL